MKQIILSCCLPVAAIISIALSNAAPAQAGNSGCYAHRPKYIEGVFEVRYDVGCTGHDEPELDPVSSAPGSGTIVLNSADSGPLMPAFDTQTIGNALGWGAVFDTPNAFVWGIGHESVFTGKGALCVAGQVGCESYDASAWAGTSPIQILSVTFRDGSQAKEWAAVSDLDGKAEIMKTCSVYGGPFCIYPWYSLGKTGFHFGVDFPAPSRTSDRRTNTSKQPCAEDPSARI